MHVQQYFSRFKVMLQETIRNNDFYCNTALQLWNNVATIQTMSQQWYNAVLR